MLQYYFDYSDYQSNTCWKNLGLILVAPLTLSLSVIWSSICVLGIFCGGMDLGGTCEVAFISARALKRSILHMIQVFTFLFKPLFELVLDVLVKISLGIYLTLLKPVFEFFKSIFNNSGDILQNQLANHPYRSLGIVTGLITVMIGGIATALTPSVGSALLPIASMLGLASSPLGIPIAIALCGAIVAVVSVACKYLYDQGHKMQDSQYIVEPGATQNP